MVLDDNPNVFAQAALDRAGHLRRDAAWLAAAWSSDAARLALFHDRRPLIGEDGAPVWLNARMRDHFAGPEEPWLFLGLDAQGQAVFALQADRAEPPAGLGRYQDLRAALPGLDAPDAATLGCAKAVFEWHARHRFCANCGAPTQVVEAGWKRLCPACNAEHFPRVDPVVIMLPAFGDTCLLGRQAGWPKGMMSALAGFMEPGETIEAATARETFEEAGIVIERVRLHSTQPWPFPSSLMIGVLCEAKSDALKIDPHELESARWFSRAEIRAMLAGAHGEFFCPPRFAIAHHLLRAWAEEAV